MPTPTTGAPATGPQNTGAPATGATSAAPVWERLVQSGTEHARFQAAQLRLPEFLMFALLVIGTQVPRLGLPVNQLMVLVIGLYGFSKRPDFRLGAWKHLLVLVVLAFVYLAAVSWSLDQPPEAADWRRRLFRLAAMTALAWFLASGRLHLRSGLLGLCLGLGANAVLFYLGLLSDTYGGWLTGFLGDKNYAGMMYCLIGILALSLVQGRLPVAAVVLATAGLLWLTGSRTALFAYAMALLWMVLAPRISGAFRLVVGLVILWLTSWATQNLATEGSFSDRVGSDALRSRIDSSAWTKVTETGPLGRGLGNAYVQFTDSVGNTTGQGVWFFHNSYWSAYVEGGWPWAALVVGITVLVVIRPFLPVRRMTRYQLLAQGAGVATLIVAWRLGEVFYTLPWAVALGFALRAHLVARDMGPTDHLDRYRTKDEVRP